jgi:hypothetical protein
METRTDLIAQAVDAVLASIDREARKGHSTFEYLDDPDELIARRGRITAMKVA